MKGNKLDACSDSMKIVIETEVSFFICMRSSQMSLRITSFE